MTQSEDQARRSRMTVRDPDVMRALAHPARLAIMEYLTEGNVATATECARVCGLSPSATSYHLRALAKAGLVEEAPSRGDGRERVWRTVVGGLNIESSSEDSDEAQAAALDLMTMVLARDQEQVARWFAQSSTESKEWYDAAGMTFHEMVITAAELTEVFARVTELLRPYGRLERPDPPAGARKVGALFRAIPAVDPAPRGAAGPE